MGRTTVNRSGNPAQRIRTARTWAGLTQAELASGLDALLGTLRPGAGHYSAATVKRTERGTRAATVEELLAVAEVCDVPATFMLHGFEPGDDDALKKHLANFEQTAKEIRGMVAGHVATR